MSANLRSTPVLAYAARLLSAALPARVWRRRQPSPSVAPSSVWCTGCRALGCASGEARYDEDGAFWCTRCWLQYDSALAELERKGESLFELEQREAEPTPARYVAPVETLCPITLAIMLEPVLLAGDGYTYEKSAITAWLKRKHTSPLTNLPLADAAQRALYPNRAMRDQCARAHRSEQAYARLCAPITSVAAIY